MTRAKFKCSYVTKSEGDERVTFTAVYGDGNETWSKYTPSGKLEMSITNEALHGAFRPGREYYIDITEVK